MKITIEKARNGYIGANDDDESPYVFKTITEALQFVCTSFGYIPEMIRDEREFDSAKIGGGDERA